MKQVFRVINEMVAARVIETYAVGGAIGATFYVEPFATTDVDIFFPAAVSSTALISLDPLYKYLGEKGYHPIHQDIEIEGWPVQFLPVYDDLTASAVSAAKMFDVDGEVVRVMPAEYLAAIALKTSRPKDLARIIMFLEQGRVDEARLVELVREFHLEEKWQKFKGLK